MKRNILFLICSLGIVFNSCQSFQTNYQHKSDAQKIEEARNSWLGQKVEEVYNHAHWGIPEQKASDGRGGMMLSYSRKSVIANPYVVGQLIPVIYITTFYINSSGLVYDMKVRREVQ